MTAITVHGGDFRKGSGWIDWNFLRLRTDQHKLVGEKIPLTELDLVEIATEDSVQKIGGAVGWGIAGAAILGPVGLLAGLLLGGRKKEITFVARFKDGRKLLATTSSDGFKQLKAAAL